MLVVVEVSSVVKHGARLKSKASLREDRTATVETARGHGNNSFQSMDLTPKRVCRGRIRHSETRVKFSNPSIRTKRTEGGGRWTAMEHGSEAAAGNGGCTDGGNEVRCANFGEEGPWHRPPQTKGARHPVHGR